MTLQSMFKRVAVIIALMFLALLPMGCSGASNERDFLSRQPLPSEQTDSARNQDKQAEPNRNRDKESASTPDQDNGDESNPNQDNRDESNPNQDNRDEPLPIRIPYFSGQIIQGWFTEYWSEQRWADEMKLMTEVGMEYLVLTSAVTKDGATSKTVTYPSALPELADYRQINILEKCLAACKAAGIKLFLDPYSDSEWWKYGWEWTTAGGKTKVDFANFLHGTRTLANKICDEVMGQYGAEYANTLYGWYWGYEIWNVTMLTAQPEDDTRAYFEILSDGLNIDLDHYTAKYPDMPMMLSPYANSTLYGTTPEQLKAQWIKILSDTHFRPFDILAPQDSVASSINGYGGVPFGQNGETLRSWTKAYYDAVKATGDKVHLWANNENFEVTGNGGVPAEVSRVIQQLEITAPFSEKHITFSYSYYYSPYRVDPRFHAAYKAYYLGS